MQTYNKTKKDVTPITKCKLDLGPHIRILMLLFNILFLLIFIITA